MLSILLDQVFKGSFRDKLVRWSFYSLQGILASILINDVIRVLYGDFEHKKEFEYGLAGAVAIAPYLIPQLTLLEHRTNNVSMGIGMLIGTYMANRTEKKQEILPL